MFKHQNKCYVKYAKYVRNKILIKYLSIHLPIYLSIYLSIYLNLGRLNESYGLLLVFVETKLCLFRDLKKHRSKNDLLCKQERF